jgi:hypothetical protein
VVVKSVRNRLVDGPDSWGAKRRGRRWTWFTETFPALADMTVLDLGGRVDTWERAPVRAAHVHVVNLEPTPADLPDWAEADHGDACALPDEIAKRRYDLVFSNSVIEHVGGHERRLRFAESVHNMAPAHWVQTPYRYFPVEPHWVAPGLQYLPIRLRRVIAHRWPLQHTRSADKEETLQALLWTELLDKTQMRHYFPSSVIRSERVAGVTKSIIAVKKG